MVQPPSAALQAWPVCGESTVDGLEARSVEGAGWTAQADTDLLFSSVKQAWVRLLWVLSGFLILSVQN